MNHQGNTEMPIAAGKFIAKHDLETIVKDSCAELKRRMPNSMIKMEVVVDSEGYEQLYVLAITPDGDSVDELCSFIDGWVVNRPDLGDKIVFDVGSL